MRKLLTATAIALFAAAGAAKAEKWDMALAYSATNYHSEIAAEFAKEITEKTDGSVEMVTHPGGSLFGGADIYGAVRRGLAPIGERLISALTNENPIYGVDSIPFMATSFDASKKLYDASKPELEKVVDEAGLHLLYSCPWPPQGFYSSRKIETTDDLKGLKFRAYNAATSTIAEGLGMIPTKIEAAEVPQAFATGVAESMISSGATGYDRKLWESVKYYYDVKAWLPRNMVVVNARRWGGLDDATKAIFTEAAANAEATCWAKAEELDSWYVEQFKANGMEVGELPEGVLAAFVAIGTEMKAEWVESAGDDGAAILEKFQAAE